MKTLLPQPAASTRYDELSNRGREATLQGDFQAALDAYLGAREIVGSMSRPDRGLQDAADLNIAMVRLQMGQSGRGAEGLREILLRTETPRIAFSAAYNLASSLRKQGRYERATSYAGRAMDHARRLGEPDLLAAGHLLLGNILLGQDRAEQALEEYSLSRVHREIQGGDTRYSMAILLENIGYCLLIRGDLEDGIENIQVALRLASEVGDRRCRAECLQDLCYGHLLRDRYEEALSRGADALVEAQEGGYRDIEENCHYLLGEIGSRTEDFEQRDRHFSRLQEMHPELPFLKDFLCTVDVIDIITLKR